MQGVKFHFYLETRKAKKSQSKKLSEGSKKWVPLPTGTNSFRDGYLDLENVSTMNKSRINRGTLVSHR
jgi:hypothetical protein